ncbi:hypothetical protein N657DRAFT_573815 [Parathielavia appendiculata]|uniref:P-loop containing nucleoside triphosphate hydrolase protein n=1 Tax=Parathielavia appendiculata TaxID=2587402 RepID=A0AAN6Z394_9PEZI|nr:hypothetical protein N657DRAFT_573815 [Parathielavia appendiculata]
MSSKPIFVATHPRACSTAFERVFMTRADILYCVHEPFGDAFYFGPERLSERYEKDEAARKKSGFANTTYKDVADSLLHLVNSQQDKRLFIKDIAHYLLPPNQQPATIAPSLRDAGTTTEAPNGTAHTDGTSPDGISHTNPTVVPLSLLRKFHFTFLIRHPRRAIPSYYRCTIPPLSAQTGFHNFMPNEAGYDELRRLFDYLLQEGVIGQQQQQTQQNGTAVDGSSNGVNGNHAGNGVKITVVDADDLLDKPAEVIRAFCEDVGIDYHDGMLKWEDEEGQIRAVEAFKKWDGFHEDAIASTELRPRSHPKKTPTEEEEDEEWRKRFGDEGQRVIRECVNANVADYEYLKSFAIKV